MVRPLIVAGVWVIGALFAVVALVWHGWWALPAALVLALAALGTWDLLQTRHAILRLYPILGHVRFLAEFIRPEIRQYFIESNTEASPFDRETRDLVYERAKGIKTDEPFGTERDVNAIGYEFLRHSMRAKFADDLAPRVRLGGPDCTQPYDIALLNVSAMSFGALSAQRDRGVQWRRGPRRIRARHRRGRDQSVSPARRRRPDLGDRLGVLRLPRRRRTVRRDENSPRRPRCRR